MYQRNNYIHRLFLIFTLTLICITAFGGVDELYTDLNDIPNPAFSDLGLPHQQTYHGPVYGSTIDVNNKLVEQGAFAQNNIVGRINIHTLCNSNISRSDFTKFSRWYQEDGKTQVFRLFKGEKNTRNSREGAARIESFSHVKWKASQGKWHEWIGMYTIVKPLSCAIFQAKNNINDWGIMLNLTSKGDIILNHRRHQSDVTIARNMTGKSFNIRVRDNGHDYEVYLNGNLVGAGYYDRPDGETNFRWGMYKGGESAVPNDALIFVTGATVDPSEIPDVKTPNLSFSSLPDNICRYDSVELTVDATTTVGHINKIELFLNDSLIGTTDTVPLTVKFQAPVTGNYPLKATATNTNGLFIEKEITLKVGRCGIPLLPTTIEAENHSNSSENIIIDSTSIDNGTMVQLNSNHWLEYTVDVEEIDSFTVKLSAFPFELPANIQLEINDTAIYSINIPDTAELNALNTYSTKFILSEGANQLIKLKLLSGELGLDKIEFIAEGVGYLIHPNPLEVFPGKSWLIPGTIEAVYFDTGGEGIAYHDADKGWLGGLRSENPRYAIAGEEDVEIEKNDGLYNIAHTALNEWLKYTIDTVWPGIYTIKIIGASKAIGGQVLVRLGEDTLGTVNIPSTSNSNWTTYKEFSIENITIPEQRTNEVLQLEFLHSRYTSSLCHIRTIEFERTAFIGSEGDSDGDGIEDEKDNCVNTPNPHQEDIDGDGIGDVCDNNNQSNSNKSIKERSDIKIYPNPANHVLYIETNEEIQALSIYTIQGKLIKTLNQPNIKEGINIKQLKPGLYLLKITDRFNDNKTVKIIRK